jgi:hypothetical protein
MPYIGNPIYQSAFVTDTFSGNGTTTAFTMSVAPAGVSNVLIAISGVLQDPATYGVVGNTLNFSQAPPTGTNNISCRYLGVPATGVTTTAYRTQTEFTATAGQTTFSVPSYTPGFIDVYRNGALLGSADYTATNGTTVVLNNAASSGDLVETISFLVSSVLNAIPATAGSVGTANIADGAITAAKMGANGTWAPAGSVIQVVNAKTTAGFTSSSSTLADTAVTATITPKFATSKILVIVTLSACGKETNSTYIRTALLRNSTILEYFENLGGFTNTTTSNYIGSIATCYLDSPATTSATTYKVQASSGLNTAIIYIGGTAATIDATQNITLMEIAG